MMPWLVAVAALVVGILLLRGGSAMRELRGLSQGRTTALDNRTLHSARYGLSGRPDRITDGVIPEEWKSSKRVYDSHRAQLGTYLILIEEESGIRPTQGVISIMGGELVQVENTPGLRDWELDVAKRIWEARQELKQQPPIRQPLTVCRVCGMRKA